MILFTPPKNSQQYESFDQNDQSDIESNPGNFEVLDSSSISKSGSFGPSEQIAINTDTDEIKDAIVPTPIDHKPLKEDQKQDQEKEDDDGRIAVESDQGNADLVENAGDSTDSTVAATAPNPISGNDQYLYIARVQFTTSIKV